jgi:hypothetical protein
MTYSLKQLQYDINQLQERVDSITDYVCVYFGNNWCITARGFANIADAHKHGLFMMPTPGCFGFVVIVHGKEFWQVREDQSIMPDSMKVEMGDFNNFVVSIKEQ